MKTKQQDVPYCSVREEKILSASPKVYMESLQYFYHYIKERYSIHLKKDVIKQPYPWTKDPILQKFRFTNIFREQDTETRWVIENIANSKSLCYEDKLLNCILFRLYNRHDTATLIGLPIKFSTLQSFDPEQYRAIFDKNRKTPSDTFFTGAFLVSGLKNKLKAYTPNEKLDNNMEMRVLYFIKYLFDSKFVSKLLSCVTQQEVYNFLCSLTGIGDFLAYQIFVDYTYILEFPFSENEFVVAGIGCKKGLDYLFADKDGMTYEECLFWLRNNIRQLFETFIGDKCSPKKLFIDLPWEDRHYNVMCLENCMCEFGKYMKTINKEGRPRQKYRQRSNVC